MNSRCAEAVRREQRLRGRVRGGTVPQSYRLPRRPRRSTGETGPPTCGVLRRRVTVQFQPVSAAVMVRALDALPVVAAAADTPVVTRSTAAQTDAATAALRMKRYAERMTQLPFKRDHGSGVIQNCLVNVLTIPPATVIHHNGLQKGVGSVFDGGNKWSLLKWTEKNSVQEGTNL